MSCEDYEIYVGDVGTAIELDTGEDLTGATGLKIEYKKPNGDEGEWTNVQVTHVNDKGYDATVDTGITYITVVDDIDMAGEWLLHAYGETVSGSWLGLGCLARMTVKDKWT